MILGGVIPLALGIISILCALSIAVISISFYTKLSANCESQSLRTNLRILIIVSVAISTILITWFICETMCRDEGRINISRAKGFDVFVHFCTLISAIMMSVLVGSIISKNHDNCKAKAGHDDSLCCISKDDTTFSWMGKVATFASIVMICTSIYFLFQVSSQFNKRLKDKYRKADQKHNENLRKHRARNRRVTKAKNKARREEKRKALEDKIAEEEAKQEELKADVDHELQAEKLNDKLKDLKAELTTLPDSPKHKIDDNDNDSSNDNDNDNNSSDDDYDFDDFDFDDDVFRRFNNISNNDNNSSDDLEDRFKKLKDNNRRK